MTIDFFIAGTPAPGGSKTAVPIRDRKGDLVLRWVFSKRYRRQVPVPALQYVDSGGSRKGKPIGDGNATWKTLVKRTARRHFQGEPIEDQPLRVLFRFYLQRPQDQHIGGDRSRGLKERFLDWLWPTTKPDALKLARSTEDALTGVLWGDDAQVAQLYIEKLYADHGQPTGCRVMVTRVIEDFAPSGLFTQEAAV